MNEQRIEELEAQCWEPRPYGPAWFNSKKFAELIVRQCARSVTWYTKQELAGVNRGQVFRANKTVLEHFGFEE